MKLSLWPGDTIAWRFGTTIVASMIVAFGLIGLFFAFGGVWAKPPMDLDARLEGATAIVRMIETAPSDMRRPLAEAAKTKTYRVDWYPSSSTEAAWLGKIDVSRNLAATSDEIRDFSRDLGRTVIVITRGDPLAEAPDFPLRSDRYPKAYFSAVELQDRSWIVFTGFNRYWGLSQTQRFGVWIAFLVFSFGIVSTLAARQLSRPIRRFERAVRHSASNSRFPPITREGPQELRDLIAAFNEMQAQIQEFVAYRVSMLAAISHDLRTPLTRMRLRGEFIADEVQQAKLFRDVDEMRAMIDGALAFFRGDADEETVRAFDLAGILQSIADDYADQNVEVPYAGPGRLVYSGRPLSLKRAFTNLIENAVKYGTRPQVELTCQPKAVIVTVWDHGPGVPDEALEKLFRPFYRLDKSRNRTTGGVGLGLTSAQAIIRGHGGRITLRNRPAGGLEVTVVLPQAV